MVSSNQNIKGILSQQILENQWINQYKFNLYQVSKSNFINQSSNLILQVAKKYDQQQKDKSDDSIYSKPILTHKLL